jgi:DNA-binding CsgD family transcriptional regulator
LARGSRTKWDRFVAPPKALAGSAVDWPVAGLLGSLLLLVFAAEMFTPDVVVGALALIPLLAAMWLLSSFPARLVAALSALLFTISLLGEHGGNRWTILVIGAVTFSLAFLVRVHAVTPARYSEDGRTVEELTHRELEVARLAGQAYTAAEIGARLHIGERTVETHLANTYTKLRISSRRELIRIASRLGPP